MEPRFSARLEEGCPPGVHRCGPNDKKRIPLPGGPARRAEHWHPGQHRGGYEMTTWCRKCFSENTETLSGGKLLRCHACGAQHEWRGSHWYRTEGNVAGAVSHAALRPSANPLTAAVFTDPSGRVGVEDLLGSPADAARLGRLFAGVVDQIRHAEHRAFLEQNLAPFRVSLGGTAQTHPMPRLATAESVAASRAQQVPAWGTYFPEARRFAFSAALLRRPEKVIEAVIAHEVAHAFLHLDGDPAFANEDRTVEHALGWGFKPAVLVNLIEESRP